MNLKENLLDFRREGERQDIEEEEGDEGTNGCA